MSCIEINLGDLHKLTARLGERWLGDRSRALEERKVFRSDVEEKLKAAIAEKYGENITEIAAYLCKPQHCACGTVVISWFGQIRLWVVARVLDASNTLRTFRADYIDYTNSPGRNAVVIFHEV